MNTKIYFVRHGNVSNPKGVFYGRKPHIYLSEDGIEQIKQTTKYFKDKKIAKIFASPLLRSRQSASIIKNALGLQNVSNSKRITEVNSFMEGIPFEECALTRFDHYFSKLRKPDNETMENISKRMISFIKSVATKYRGQNVVVVGHGDPLMILRAVILKLPMQLDSIRSGDSIKYIVYGEIYEVEIDDSWKFNIKSVFQPKQKAKLS